MQICSRNKNSGWEISKAYDNHLFFPTVRSRSSLPCFVPLVDFLNLAVVYEVILWCPHQSDLLLKAVNLQVALGSYFQFPLTVIYTSNPQLYFNHFSIYARVCARMLSGVLLVATPWTVAARLLCSWDFPDKNTGVGCHFLFQGIFLTRRSYPCLLHWQMGSSPLSLTRLQPSHSSLQVSPFHLHHLWKIVRTLVASHRKPNSSLTWKGIFCFCNGCVQARLDPEAYTVPV